jgi:hypothetical protein
MGWWQIAIMGRNLLSFFYALQGIIRNSCTFLVLISMEEKEKRRIVESLTDPIIAAFIASLDQ